MLELKSFLRLTLEPGESRRITFDVPVAQLGFHDRDLSYVVEPGAIEVFVGTVVRGHGRRCRTSVTVVSWPRQTPAKAFDGSVAVD